MKRTLTAFVAAILLCLTGVGREAYAQSDADGNGIDDDDEVTLAAMFSPSFMSNPEDHGMVPKSVDIMGVDLTDENNYFVVDVTTVLGQTFQAYTSDTWSISSISEGEDYDWCSDDYVCSDGDYSTYQMALHGTMTPPYSANGWYYTAMHPDFGGPSVNTIPEWYSLYDQVEDNYTDTIYPHLFLDGDETVIQYWFFYPFNPWVGRHEGDWEHINVILDSSDPEEAEIVRIDFHFHNAVLPRDPGEFYLDDDTHPVVFNGGYGSRTVGFTTWEGESGHGSYPNYGTFPDAGGGGLVKIDEHPVHGLYTPWSDFTLEIIPNPSAIDFSENPEMSWLGAMMLWGELYTEDSIPWGDFVSEVGLAFWNIVAEWWLDIAGYGMIPEEGFANTPPVTPPWSTAWNRTSEDAHHGYDEYSSNDVPSMLGWPADMSVAVAGPTQVEDCEMETWEPVVDGGLNPFEYQWEFFPVCPEEMRAPTCNVWHQGTATEMFQHQSCTGFDFKLRVTATDYKETEETSNAFYVTVVSSKSGEAASTRAPESIAADIPAQGVGREPAQSDRMSEMLPIYPNPFNPSVNVPFALATSADVRIDVFDILGRKVATLANGRFEEGEHFVVFEAGHLPSGSYIIRFRTSDYSGDASVATRIITLQK